MLHVRSIAAPRAPPHVAHATPCGLCDMDTVDAVWGGRCRTGELRPVERSVPGWAVWSEEGVGVMEAIANGTGASVGSVRATGYGGGAAVGVIEAIANGTGASVGFVTATG